MGNRLSKIVTRTGDGGTTGLSDGSRIEKDTPRIEAIGTIDELSSHAGHAQSLLAGIAGTESLSNMISLIQHDLFDLGGSISHPQAELLSEAHVQRIEHMVAELNATLPPLKEFILPGGAPAISAMHITRCVARRAERRLKSLLDQEPQAGRFGLAYLNRLSDLFFIMARTIAREMNVAEHYWEKGKSLS